MEELGELLGTANSLGLGTDGSTLDGGQGIGELGVVAKGMTFGRSGQALPYLCVDLAHGSERKRGSCEQGDEFCALYPSWIHSGIDGTSIGPVLKF